MELKQYKYLGYLPCFNRSNRTFMELKRSFVLQRHYRSMF